MISLADFVVVTEDAHAINYIGQSVFELMNRTGNWLRNLPEREFGEGCFRINDASTDKLNCLHVGDITNMPECCQLLQRQKNKGEGEGVHGIPEGPA